MKYIRTSFEIEETKNLQILNDKIAYKKVMIGGKLYTVEVNIVKPANTIEELCDEFVEESTPLMKPSIRKYNKKLFINNIKDLSKYDYKVYGAIWTPKGLIYAAKAKGILPNGEIDWELI